MKSKLAVLTAAVMLPAAIVAQSDAFAASSAATSSQTPLTLLSENPPSTVCAPVPAGAVAWWRAESNTVDTVGVNDVLFGETPYGTPLYMTGKVGTAFRLLGSRPPFVPSNDLFVPRSTDLDVGSGAGFTIEGWLNPSAVTYVQPVAEWNDGKGNIGAGLALNGTALEAIFTDTNSSPVRRAILRSGTGIFAASVWHHVALTFDKSSGQVLGYVDGVAVAQTNLGTFRPATQAPVFLGSRLSGTNAGTYFGGGLDELTLYSRSLTLAEIQAVVAAGSAGKCVPPPPPPVPPPAGIIGWWRGEANALDSVDSNNGLIANGVGYVNGVVGKGFSLGSGYVRIPAASNFDVGSGPGLTIEAWVSPDALKFLNPIATEYVGWHSGTITQGVSLSTAVISQAPPYPPFRADSAVWQANVADTQGRSHIFHSPADLATLGVWQHVALTYDKASGVAVLYFNGNPVTQTNFGSFRPQTAADLNLGYISSIPLPPRGGVGALDEVSLYARALSPAEIRAIMLSRGTGKSKDPPLIQSSPVGIVVNAGATVTFSTMAAGNPILKYQWRRNSVSLPGATGSSLVLTNVQLAQAGTYSVRVTNAFGVVVSSNAVLTVNLFPVADSSATQPLAIAPLHCDATVVLDGSRSSDPDGGPLHFFWFKAGASIPFATGVVAVVTLPPGIHPLVLAVDDGMATNSQSFTVEVDTVAQAVERLIARVNADASKPQPLVASLSAALRSINRDDPTPAINQLGAFQNKTRAQVAPALAQILIQSAQQLIALLGTDCSPARPPASIAKATRQANGKLRMQFIAPEGFAYILEASTDMVHWEKIAVATASGEGKFDVEDASTPQMPARFYRLVAP